MDLITLALSKKFTSDAIEAIDEAKVDKTDIVQSDWNQNDETSLDYIKNRPFGTTGKYIETTFGENLSFELAYPSLYMAPKDTLSNHSLVMGAKYKIVIDGEEYIRFAQNNNSRVFLGNEKNDYITVLMGNADWSTGDPFYYEDGILTVKTSNPTCNVSLYELKEEILLLDKKYINYIAGENIEGKKVSYENEDYICGSGAEVFNDIMSNIAIGKYSHAEGDSTKAIGRASHAEGYNTKATGEYSHAEGFGATAEKWAHAEGYDTDANGTASHAEGYMTKTASVGSHAEGKNTEALGGNSHAEGECTKAIGYSQHVQGKYNIPDTSAAYVSASISQGSYPYQDGETIVYLCPEKPILNAEEGYYTLNQKCIPVAIKDITADSNILYSEPQNNIIQGYFIFHALIDTKISDGITYYQWKYSEIYCELNSEGFGSKLAHIVGNGTKEDARSNAHTLDWDGNAWYQGDVFVGSTSGTNKDEGSKKLATEEYVNTEVANLVNSAPETLDTLGELATALKENSDIVDILNSAITNKADKSEIVQSDYNQNDETALDYIKNRPFYEGDLEEYYVLEETTIEAEHDLTSGSHAIFKSFLEVGKTYEVLFDGNVYLVECLMGENGATIGDTSLQEYPFYLFDFTFMSALNFEPRETPVTISIKVRNQEIKKLERKFVEGIAGMDVEGKIFSYNDNNYTAQNGAEIFNDYLNNIAIGSCSHAEGVRTVATNIAAHAEGGGAIASGMQSHAEGLATTAGAANSHAEGNNTIASGEAQHVQGKYNIEDTENKYAHIVGNGAYNIRSNAHTLDWNGNAWFAGDVYVGGTSQNDASKLGEKDWNVNDEANPAYIKNRPFYSPGEYEEVEILKDGVAYDLTALFGAYVVMECPTLENKHTYRFIFNGQEYIRTSAMNKNGYIGVGDISYINNGTWEDGKDPFYLEFYGGSCFIYLKDSKLNSTISIYETKEIIYSIDKKYIEKHLAGNKADQEYIYEDKFYTSQINAEYFNDASNIAIGENSHAEGKASVALGEYSHAEGYSSRAIGRSSHAGAGGEAIGDYSFAHNSSTASGIDSVAFGSLNEAYGRSSFVEGSHSIANGGYQHVQGKYNIPEDRLYRRVIFTMNSNSSPTYDGEKIVYLLESTPTFDYFTGKYTITGVTTPTAYKDLQPNNTFLFEDITETTVDSYYLVESLIETKEDESGNVLYKWDLCQYSSEEYRDEGKYVHIVGNGTYDVKSNAYTLDWKGNGWYQGTVEATGLILSSPNGTRFKITVGDDGVLTSTKFTEEEKPFRPGDVYKSIL